MICLILYLCKFAQNRAFISTKKLSIQLWWVLLSLILKGLFFPVSEWHSHYNICSQKKIIPVHSALQSESWQGKKAILSLNKIWNICNVKPFSNPFMNLLLALALAQLRQWYFKSIAWFKNLKELEYLFSRLLKQAPQ